MKSIKVKQKADDNSVRVRIEHSAKMATAVDKLLTVSDGEFKQIVKVSKQYRKANKSMAKFIDEESVRIKIESNKANSIIINNLIDLGNREYRKAIRCAKQYRKANQILESAVEEYVELQKEDNASFQTRRTRLAYEYQ